MKEITVKVHEIATDGLPPKEDDGIEAVGRIAFLWDGNIVSGWPLEVDSEDGSMIWEGDSDVARHPGKFYGVTHWVEFPMPLWDLEKEDE